MSDVSSDIGVAIVRPSSINWFSPPPPGETSSPTSQKIWTPTMVPLAAQPSSAPTAAAQYAAQIRASPPSPTPVRQREDHGLIYNVLLGHPIYHVDSSDSTYRPLLRRTGSNSDSPILGLNPYTPPMPEGEWFASRLETPPTSPAKSISEKIRSLFAGVKKRARRLSKSVKRSPRARAVRSHSGPMKMLDTEISLIDLVATVPAPAPAVLIDDTAGQGHVFAFTAPDADVINSTPSPAVGTDDFAAQGGEAPISEPGVDDNDPAPGPAVLTDDLAAQGAGAAVDAPNVVVIHPAPGSNVLADDIAARDGGAAVEAARVDVNKPLPAGPANTDKTLPPSPPPTSSPPAEAAAATPAPVSRVPSWSHSVISSWRTEAAHAFPPAMAPAPAPPSVNDEESGAISDVPDLESDKESDNTDDRP